MRLTRGPWKLLAAFLGPLLASLPAFAQISQNVGTLAPGESVTIVYDVTIDSPLAVSVTQISHQGTFSGDNFASFNTDDPETPAANDATVTVLAQNFDYGDAPDPTFPTLIANDGARHFIPAGGAILYLGATAPDAETDGQPNSTATGDDAAGTDDEDGLTFPAPLRAGATESVPITVTGTGGLLSLWIDWNQDGDWNDGGEQVLSDQSVAAGSSNLSIAIPGTASAGASFARVRISTQAGLAVTGAAPDGEVEDHAVTVAVNTPPVAGADTIERFATQDVKVKVSALLSNDTDADTDALSLSSVGSPLPAGAGVTRVGDWVFYTPPGGSADPGSFTYVVSDGRGGSDTGTVTVAIKTDNARSQNVLGIEDRSGGVFRVTFLGIPGRTYSVQYADTLNPPNTVWTFLGSVTADSTGLCTIDDPAGSTMRFYRTLFP